LGAGDYELGPLKNELIYKPLVRLNRYQDWNVIEHAELRVGEDLSFPIG
jgi:hypothetical protein